MKTSHKILVGAALVGGVVLLSRSARAQKPSCTQSYECPIGTVCYQGKCVDKATGKVDYAGDRPLDDLLSWFKGWLEPAEPGPITHPWEVESFAPFDQAR